MLNPSPICRGLATLLALVGTFLAKDALLVASVYCAVLVPLLVSLRLLRTHAKFVLAGVLPLAIGLLILWGVVIGAAPGLPHGSAPIEGVKHAILMSLRLAMIAGLFQLCLLSLPFGELMSVLANWGIRGDGQILVAGSLTVWPELQLRAGQIVTARYARGLVKNRSLLTTIRQLPFLLRPLLTWVLHTGILRAELWHQQNLIERAREATPPKNGTIFGNAFFLGIAASWMTVNVIRFLR
ncbi:MAG: hypothetical protein HY360_14620 [Verrucomicrobia bacterium]|nr:hypothetical protein [Verrucomicrobiota bacterium]